MRVDSTPVEAAEPAHHASELQRGRHSIQFEGTHARQGVAHRSRMERHADGIDRCFRSRRSARRRASIGCCGRPGTGCFLLLVIGLVAAWSLERGGARRDAASC